MSMHRQNDGPELTKALKAHGLAIDEPSISSDAFRLGWQAAIEQAPRERERTMLARTMHLVDSFLMEQAVSKGSTKTPAGRTALWYRRKLKSALQKLSK